MPDWPDDHYSVDPAKAAFFASGVFAQLHDPKATIEHAAEVVRNSSHADSRNFWPMRAANARVEWAMVLVDLGDEDAAVTMATLALDPEWLRPDTGYAAFGRAAYPALPLDDAPPLPGLRN